MTHRKRHYLASALAAREFLRRTQADLRMHRPSRPSTLPAIGMHPPEYRAGVLDGAYLLTTLEGVLVDPHRWDVFDLLEREET